MFTTIIIDRVGNTNVFNIIQNDIHQHFISESNSLQSITDEDLIQEYLFELTNIAEFSRSIIGSLNTQNPDGTLMFHHMDIRKRLHQVGETFYRQFFPPILQEIFTEKQDEYLYFHVDPKLASIPLEILSNGKEFLWERFYIGKSVKGRHASSSDVIAKDNLSMLIIADPTQDLEWARREGEELFEHLSTKFPEKKLQLELIAGKQITKLSLLNDLVGKDLIHYSGHLHYTDDIQENGWVLCDNKIIHAREIQKSGASPLLIFSNSCVSGRNLGIKTSWYENFASSFLKSGNTNYIGTLWELPDTQQTLKFTLHLYDNIFQGHPVGYSLFLARQFAKENFIGNDLTWASYLLMGNPLSKVFQKESRIPDLSQNTLDSKMVLKKYPYPIALSYAKTLELQHSDGTVNNKEKFETFYELFETTLLFISGLIFANYEYLNVSKPVFFSRSNMVETMNSVYNVLKIMDILKSEGMIPNLAESLYEHKDEIFKIIHWKAQYDEGEINENSLEGYAISLQYLLERLLIHLEYLKSYGFYRVTEPGYVQLSLHGLPRYHNMKEMILPTQTELQILDEITERTRHLVGKCIFYIPVKRAFLDLSPFLEINILEEDKSNMKYEIIFKDTSKSNKENLSKGKKPPQGPVKNKMLTGELKFPNSN